MPLPTLTSNSPSAGYIAWTAFGISYDGSNYSVPAGSSNKKYVYWKYNAGVPQILGVDALPDLAYDDYLLFLNKNGVGLIVDQTQIIDGSLLVTGSVLADAIGANQIDTFHLRANSVTIDQLAVNSVGASEIVSGSVTASKLSVGAVGANKVLNGSFEDGVEGWVLGESNGVVDVVTGVSSAGQYALRLVKAASGSGNVQAIQDPSDMIPVTSVAGRKWYVACRAGAPAAAANGFYLRAHWFQADKVTPASTATSDVVSNGALTTAWGVFENQLTPPANARYMRLSVYNAGAASSTVYVDEIVAQEVVISAQIGDGQIVAAKMAVDSVLANSIAAGQISTTKLLVGNFENLLEDPGFETNSVLAWTNGTANVTKVTTTPRTGSRALRIKSVAAAYEASRHVAAIPVDAGDEYVFGGWVRAEGSGTTAVDGLEFNVYYGTTEANASSTANDIKVTSSGAAIGSTYTLIAGKFTIPAGAKFIRPRIVCRDTTNLNVYLVDDMTLYRRVNGALIVDGTIDALQLAAGSVIAGKLAADSVATENLQAGSVTTPLLAAGAVVTEILAAGAVAADNIQSGAVQTNHLSADVGGQLDISANTSINLLVGAVGDVQGDLDSTNDNLQEMQTYYQFGADGAIISTPDSPFSVALRSDSIEMLENGNVVSYWNSGQMYVSSLVGEQVILGNHKIEVYGTGTVVRAL